MSNFIHCSVFFPLRISETQNDNVREELLNVKSAAETPATSEPMFPQTKQEENKDMVSCQAM